MNGSNSRFYRLGLDSGQSFYQIGTDGGFLPSPVQVKKLLLALAERADVIINFTGISQGTQILLMNDAKAPFPDGDELVIPEVMQIQGDTAHRTRHEHHPCNYAIRALGSDSSNASQGIDSERVQVQAR